MPEEKFLTGGAPQRNSQDFRQAREYHNAVNPNLHYDAESEFIDSPDPNIDYDSNFGEFVDNFYNSFIGVLEGVANAPAAVFGSADLGDGWEGFWSGWADNVNKFFDDNIYAETNAELLNQYGSARQKQEGAPGELAGAIGAGFGQLAEQLLWFVPGLNLAKGAGTLGKLGKLSKYVSTTGKVINPISKSGKATNWIAKNNELVTFLNGAAQQWSSVYQEARDNGISGTDSIRMANVISGIVGMSEKAGLDYFGSVISKGTTNKASRYAMNKALSKLTKEEVENGLTKKSINAVTREFAKDFGFAMRNKGSKALSGFVGEGSQEFSQTYLEEISKQLYDTAFSEGNEFGASASSDDTFKEAIFAGLVGGVVGGTTTTFFSGKDGGQKEALFQSIDMAVKRGDTRSIEKVKAKYAKKYSESNSMLSPEMINPYIDEIVEFSKSTQDMSDLSPTDRYKMFASNAAHSSVQPVLKNIEGKYNESLSRNDGTDIFYKKKLNQISTLSAAASSAARGQIMSSMGFTEADNESKSSFEKRMDAYSELATKVDNETISDDDFLKELGKVTGGQSDKIYSELTGDQSESFIDKFATDVRNLAQDIDKPKIDRLLASSNPSEKIQGYDMAVTSAMLNPASQEELPSLIQKAETYKQDQKLKKEEENKEETKEEIKDSSQEERGSDSSVESEEPTTPEGEETTEELDSNESVEETTSTKEVEKETLSKDNDSDLESEFEKLPESKKQGVEVKTLNKNKERVGKRRKSKSTVNRKNLQGGKYSHTTFGNNQETQSQKEVLDKINQVRNNGTSINLTEDQKMYQVTNPDGTTELKSRTTSLISEKQEYLKARQTDIDSVNEKLKTLESIENPTVEQVAEISELKKEREELGKWTDDVNKEKAALTVGSGLDELIREVLMGDVSAYDLDNDYNFTSRNVVKDSNGNPVNQETLISRGAKKELVDLVEYFADNGYVVVADGVKVIGPNQTGELDLLVISPEGNVEILDMKNFMDSNQSLLDGFVSKEAAYRMFGQRVNLTKPQSYMAQQFVYKRAFEQQFGIPVSMTRLIPIKATYKRDNIIHPTVEQIDLRSTIILTEDSAPREVIRVVDEIIPNASPYLPAKKSFNQLVNMGEKAVYNSLVDGSLKVSDLKRYIGQPNSDFIRRAINDYEQVMKNSVLFGDPSSWNANDIDDVDLGDLFQSQKSTDSQGGTSILRRQNPKGWNMILNHFKKMYPSVPIEVIESATWNYGPDTIALVSSEGIKLNKDQSFQHSVAHEIAHVYTEFLKKDSPKMLEKGLELVEETGFMQWAIENYPELDYEGQRWEALQEMLGVKSASELISRSKQTGNAFTKLTNWLTKFWNRVKSLFGSKEAAVDIMVDELISNSRNIQFQSQLTDYNEQRAVRKNAQINLALTQRLQKIFVARNIDNLVNEKPLDTASDLYKIAVKNLYDFYVNKPISPVASKQWNDLFGTIDFFKEDTDQSFLNFAQQLNFNPDKKISKLREIIVTSVTNQAKSQVDLIDEFNDMLNEEYEDVGRNVDRSFKNTGKMDKDVLYLIKNIVDDNGNAIETDMIYEVLGMFPEQTSMSGYLKALKNFSDVNKDSPLGYIANRILALDNRLKSKAHQGKAERVNSLRKKTFHTIANKFTPVFVSQTMNDKRTGFETRNKSTYHVDDVSKMWMNITTYKNRLLSDKGTIRFKDKESFIQAVHSMTSQDVIRLIADSMGYKDVDVDIDISLSSMESFKEELQKNSEYRFGEVNDKLARSAYSIATAISKNIHDSTLANRFLGQEYQRRSAIQDSNPISRFVNEITTTYKNGFETLKSGGKFVFGTDLIYSQNLGVTYNGSRVDVSTLDIADRLISSLFNNSYDGSYNFVSLGQLNDREHDVMIGVNKDNYSAIKQGKVNVLQNFKKIIEQAIEVTGNEKEVFKRFNEQFPGLKVKRSNTKITFVPNETTSQDTELIIEKVKKLSEEGNSEIKDRLRERFGLKPKDTLGELKKRIDKELRTQSYVRFLLQNGALGNPLIFQDSYNKDNSIKKKGSDNYTKRSGGGKTPGARIKLKGNKKIFTFVVKNDNADSVKYISDNFYNEMAKYVGEDNIGPNMKDNQFYVDPKTGEQLYIKAATLNQEGQKGNGQGFISEHIDNLKEQIAKKHNMPVDSVYIQIVDTNALKGSHRAINNAVSFDDLSKAVESGNYSHLPSDGLTLMFNINKDLTKKTNLEKKVGMSVQLSEVLSAYNVKENGDTDSYSQLIVDQLKQQSSRLWDQFNDSNKLLSFLTNTNVDFLTDNQKEVLNEIRELGLERAKTNEEFQMSFDHPAVATVIKGMLRKKVNQNALSLNIQGINAQIIPDYGTDSDKLAFDNGKGFSEVAAPWTLYFERQPKKDGSGKFMEDEDMIKYANEQLALNPEKFQMITARVPVSGPMSGFAGQVKRFVSGKTNTVSVPSKYLEFADADHDGDKMFMYVSDRDGQGNEIPGPLTDYVNQSVKIASGKKYNEDRRFKLDFEETMGRILSNLKSKGLADTGASSDFTTNKTQFEQAVKMRLAEIGIGVGASMNKTLYHMDSYGVTLKEPIEIDGKMYSNLGISEDKSNLVLMSQMLQGFLDVGNNPIILDLGLNVKNLSQALVMAQLGVPENTIFELVNNPLVKEYVDARSGDTSAYSPDKTDVPSKTEYIRSVGIPAFDRYNDKGSVIQEKDTVSLRDTATTQKSINKYKAINPATSNIPVFMNGDYYVISGYDGRMKAHTLTKVDSDVFMSLLPESSREGMKGLLEYARIESVSSTVNQLRELLTAKKDAGVSSISLIKRLNYLKKLQSDKFGLNIGNLANDPMIKYLEEVNNQQLSSLQDRFLTESPLAINFMTSFDGLKGVNEEELHNVVSNTIQKSLFLDAFYDTDLISNDMKALVKSKSSLSVDQLGNKIQKDLYSSLERKNNKQSIDSNLSLILEVLSFSDGNISVAKGYSRSTEMQKKKYKDAFLALPPDMLSNLYAYGLAGNVFGGSSSVSNLFPADIIEDYLNQVGDEIDLINKGVNDLFYPSEGNQDSPLFTTQQSLGKQMNVTTAQRNFNLRVNTSMMLKDKLVTVKNKNLVREGGVVDINPNSEYVNFYKKQVAFLDEVGNLYVKPFTPGKQTNVKYIRIPDSYVFNKNGNVKFIPLNQKIIGDSKIDELIKMCR